ncbi:hypothetical protein ACFL4D_00330 [Candidatus Margulisiibacteriota bacterium]
MKTVWIDLLCWSSALKLFFLIRKYSVEKIIYVNVVRAFLPFIPYLEKIIRAPVCHIASIEEGAERLAGSSLYECIQMKITRSLEKYVSQDIILQITGTFCSSRSYNPEKFNNHLKEVAYPYIYRPIEISVLADKVAGLATSVFIFRTTPFHRLLQETLASDNVFFYKPWFSHLMKHQVRPDSLYDSMLNKQYFASHFLVVIKTAVSWVFISIIGLIGSSFTKGMKPLENGIGVEISQSRIRLNEINELFWLKDSGILPQTVCSIEFENLDLESHKILREIGVRGFKYSRNPLSILRQIAGKTRAVDQSPPLFPDSVFLLKTLLPVLRLIATIFFPGEKAWLRYQQSSFEWKTEYWKSIYKKLGISVLWSMKDIDPDKLSKAQAIEKLGGIFAGGHWSNFPMYRVDNQKCYDVLLTWGNHFIDNNFNRHPFLEIFQTGYPLDFYFKQYKAKAAEIKKRYPQKFILSYQDNIMANDLPYSKSMQVLLHKMLLSIIDKNDNVVVLLKPKRMHVFERIVKELPRITEYIDTGKVVPFFGETARTKAVPAEIGMASDLVIGLGISTTAAECYFSGTVSFHADLTGFTLNKFGNQGLGNIVFRDTESLKKAVLDRVSGEDKRSWADYKQYYKTLDGFQDGLAYSRTGFILRRIQEHLSNDLSQQETVKSVRREYDDFLL